MAELEEEAEFWLPSGVLADDVAMSSESSDEDELLSFEALSLSPTTKSTEAFGSPESTLWDGWSSGSPSSLSSSPLENYWAKGILHSPKPTTHRLVNEQRKYGRPNIRRHSGYSGMRAVFLSHPSGRETAGTGVFLPRTDGGAAAELRKKPACSTVLLPARVVQALNLDLDQIAAKSRHPIVREIGADKATRVEMERSDDVSLPLEWTY